MRVTNITGRCSCQLSMHATMALPSLKPISRIYLMQLGSHMLRAKHEKRIHT